MTRPQPVAGPERLPKLDSASYTHAQRIAAEALLATPRGEVRGPFIPLIRSPELLNRAQAVGEYLRYRCTVPERLREFAILVTARHWRQPYEWHAHVRQAVGAGILPVTLESLAEGRALEGAADDEKLVHAFVTELHCTQAVDDEIYQRMIELLGEVGVVDLVGLCGYYAMLAMMLNVARSQSPECGFLVPE